MVYAWHIPFICHSISNPAGFTLQLNRNLIAAAHGFWIARVFNDPRRMWDPRGTQVGPGLPDWLMLPRRCRRRRRGETCGGAAAASGAGGGDGGGDGGVGP